MTEEEFLEWCLQVNSDDEIVLNVEQAHRLYSLAGDEAASFRFEDIHRTNPDISITVYGSTIRDLVKKARYQRAKTAKFREWAKGVLENE